VVFFVNSVYGSRLITQIVSFTHTKKKLDSISLFSKQQTNKLKSIVIHGCMVGMITATIIKTDNNPARNLSITDQVPTAT
jgi:hypothetical protein